MASHNPRTAPRSALATAASPARVAVLMLCYNGGADAIECLRSLQPEMDHVDAIFVSDNASTDGTKELLRREEEALGFTFLDRDENLGFAGGFNDLFEHALRHSSAEYFLALNNDTTIEEPFLPSLLREAAPDRVVSPMIVWDHDAGTVIQSAGDFDRQRLMHRNLFAGKHRDEVPPGVHRVEQTDGCCFLIHRQWLARGFRFDEQFFIYFEDVELFDRLQRAGVRFFYTTHAVLRHKEYGSSGGRFTPSPFRNYYYYRNRLYIAEKMHPMPGRLLVYGRLLEAAWRRFFEVRERAPEVARAIVKAHVDFCLGRMGKGI